MTHNPVSIFAIRFRPNITFLCAHFHSISVLKASSHRFSLYLSPFNDDDLDETIISHGSAYLCAAAVHRICGFFTSTTILYLQVTLLNVVVTEYYFLPKKTSQMSPHTLALSTYFLFSSNKQKTAFQVTLHKLYSSFLNAQYYYTIHLCVHFCWITSNGILAKISVNQRCYYLCAQGIIITPVIRTHDIRPYAVTSVCTSLPLPPSHLILLKYQQEEFVYTSQA